MHPAAPLQDLPVGHVQVRSRLEGVAQLRQRSPRRALREDEHGGDETKHGTAADEEENAQPEIEGAVGRCGLAKANDCSQKKEEGTNSTSESFFTNE